jgi:hypothetical protein
MNKICINFFTLFIIINFNFIYNEPIFVYEHVRHGARGPASEYRSLFDNKTFYDEYKIHWDGDGELTLRGKMQHYILGIRNRYKYPNLLNYSKYDSSELLIHTTNSSRVKQSAFSQILGMFLPTEIGPNSSLITTISKSKKFFYPPNYNVWKYKTTSKYKKIINEAEISIQLAEKGENESKLFLTDENYFNIVHTPFRKNRTFFKRGCINHAKYINYNHRKNYKKMIKGFLEKKYGNQLQKFFEYENKDWLYGIHRSFSIIDHFIVNYEEGRDLHYFLNSTGINKDEFYKSCKKVYEWWLFHIFCDKKSCVMESSKLMEDLVEYMENKINNKTNNLKMVIDFGHDVTVGPMQLFMYKAFNIHYTVCAFACNIYFELHKQLKKQNQEIYMVRYYVDDDLRLNINYKEFKRSVLNNIWSQKDKDEFCKGNILKVLHPKLFMLLYIVLFIAFVVIISLVINKYYKIYMKDSFNKDGNEEEDADENNKKNLLNKNRKFEKENNEDAKEMDIIK